VPRYRALPLWVDGRSTFTPSRGRTGGPRQQVSEVLERLSERIVTAAHFKPAKKRVIPMKRAAGAVNNPGSVQIASTKPQKGRWFESTRAYH